MYVTKKKVLCFTQVLRAILFYNCYTLFLYIHSPPRFVYLHCVWAKPSWQTLLIKCTNYEHETHPSNPRTWP